MLRGLFYCINISYRQTKYLVIYCTIQLQLYYGNKMCTNLLQRLKTFLIACHEMNDGISLSWTSLLSEPLDYVKPSIGLVVHARGMHSRT